MSLKGLEFARSWLVVSPCGVLARGGHWISTNTSIKEIEGRPQVVWFESVPNLAWRVESACVKVREVIRMIEEDGWYLIGTKGSHRQFRHASKPGRVTVPGHPNDDLAPGTLNSVLKQAGLKRKP